jgi:hypothetical protein
VLRTLWLAPLLLPLAAPIPAEAGRRRIADAIDLVLNRAGYGPDAWSRERIGAIGPMAYVQEQLHPESIDDGALEPLLAQFPSLEMSYLELYGTYGGPSQPLAAEVLHQIREARILRAVASRRQLQEILVDFWFNHFNIYVANAGYWDISPYERLVIRPHVLGSFEDMLLGVAVSPAMLIYLDNNRNTVGSRNENYARELLELHTLGVGNFTENDVAEAARCLTGWKHDITDPSGSRFHPELHDQGAKSLLGALEIPANGGSQDTVDLIHFLATHPATAARISRKLAVRFVSEDPPQALVDRAAAVFLQTGGDLRAVTETILQSPEFLSSPRSKVKRPLHLLASAVRATGADRTTLNLKNMASRLYELDEPLYRVRPPTGLPEASVFWASPGALLVRFNLMESIARRDGYVFSYPAAAGVAELVDALVARYFSAGVSTATRSGAIAFGTGLGLPANAPELAEQTTAYLLSSPEFLSH